MGLGSTTIRFPQGFPAFSKIKKQYEAQTGLCIVLTARIHLVETSLASLADVVVTPSQILPLLHADATSVQQLEASYVREKELVLSVQDYEMAAANRDKVKQDKLAYNHIHNVELVVSSIPHSSCEQFYSIELEVISDMVTVYQHSDQEYCVESFLKVLVDLGGVYPRLADKAPQTTPNHWSKLKQWKDYKWYNRPKK